MIKCGFLVLNGGCDEFLWVVEMVIAVQVIPENIISRLLQTIQHNEVFWFFEWC